MIVHLGMSAVGLERKHLIGCVIWERGGGKGDSPQGDVSAHERAVTQAV